MNDKSIHNAPRKNTARDIIHETCQARDADFGLVCNGRAGLTNLGRLQRICASNTAQALHQIYRRTGFNLQVRQDPACQFLPAKGCVEPPSPPGRGGFRAFTPRVMLGRGLTQCGEYLPELPHLLWSIR
jgi:hypothetical protein